MTRAAGKRPRRIAKRAAAQALGRAKTRVAELERTSADDRDSRRATLNVLEDAVAARELAERLNQDLREREAWMRGQREALAAAVNLAPLPTSLGVLVRTATEALGPDVRAAFYLADDDGTSLHHVVGMGAAYAKAVEGVGIGPESLARGLATHTGEPVLTTDVETDPRWEPWRGMAARFDYRGCWSFPIHTGAGRYVGTLAIYAREPREATERDLELAALLTQTAAIIVAQHAEAAARKRAADALRASEARFRAFVTTGSDVVYRMSPDWSEMRALDGQGFLSDTPEPTDAWMNRYIHPDDQAEVAAAVARAVRDKTMFRLEHRVRRSDGSLAWTLSRAIPLFDERGEITEWIGAATNLTPNKQTAEAAKTSQRRPGRVK